MKYIDLLQEVVSFCVRTAFNTIVTLTGILTFSLMISAIGDLLLAKGHTSFLFGWSCLLGLFSLGAFGIIGYQVWEFIIKRQLKEEMMILAIAKEKGGQLSLSQIALEAKFSIAKTKHALARLAASGICTMTFFDSTLSYTFPSFEKTDGENVDTAEKAESTISSVRIELNKEGALQPVWK
ncbi:MAG: hypothetical protein JST89_26395 [Cyanobacteria bacterium SZAS-4]|nr:hypothetical protein [Cyanobacteria bacterium SZAS-4]